ncbi:MAG: outer membrane beta-barrel family protein [Muribaculaceae bacterium]|nr:outer membrane beta-barrel family protein [Muribaculaceae bacterium]
MVMTAASWAADTGFILRGYVMHNDSAGTRVPLDSVMLSLNAVNDTAAVRFKMLEGDDAEKMNASNGAFRAMVYAPPGKYVLTLEREGYDIVMKDVERKYKDQTTVWLGTIMMKPERRQELKEVEVVSTAIKVVMKGDTIVYNADAFNLGEGSMLDALVKQLPGAELKDGVIKVNGRAITSLLLNGKDFFKEDPSVALENLPAYAVKNVKVYDKAGEDDYLTKASQTLDRNEDSENLVMDVVLKKEYSTSWMASIEAGYGTADRWIGKGFGLGFTDKFRLSAFVNTNNLSDFTEANNEGEWSHTWGSDGMMEVEMGGIDYLYDDGKRWKVTGNAVHSHEIETNRGGSLSTEYFSTGNYYNRSDYKRRYTCEHFRTNHNLNYKGDNVYLYVNPKVDWYSNNTDRTSRSAQFDEMPEEWKRSEALDSVFLYDPSTRYNDILINRLKQLERNASERLDLILNSSLRYRTAEMLGSWNFNLNGRYNHQLTRNRKLYLQNYGGANPLTTPPMREDRFSRSPSKNYQIGPSVNYNQRWTRLNEVYSDALSLDVNAAYQYAYNDNTYDIFTRTLLPDSPVPSLTLTRPEDAIQMLANSKYTETQNSNLKLETYVSLNREPVAPADSGLNLAYNLSVGLAYNWIYESMDYQNMADYHQRLDRHQNRFSPTVRASIRSSNKKRNISLYGQYNTYTNAPSLASLIPIPNTDDPLSIREPIDKNLKDQTIHRIFLNFSRYGRGEHRENTYAYLSMSIVNNAWGSWAVFNPETGVTRSRTVNIDGNQNLYASVSHHHNLGSRNQFQVGGGVGGNYSINKDYYIASTDPDAVPELNKSFYSGLHGSLSFGYTFKNGSNVSLNGGANWTYSDGMAGGVKNITSAMTYAVGLDADVELPWKIKFGTEAMIEFNRGFETRIANQTRYRWNAELSKSILKGDLTFKIKAYDILNSRTDFDVYSTAISYRESWSKSLPRHVLFSVVYRFRKTPAKK